MAVFLKRPMGYQVGLVALLLSTVLYITGFSAPFWGELTGSRWHTGIWVHCTSSCFSYGVGGIEETWFYFVRAAATVGLMLLLLACLYGLYANCRLQPTAYSTIVEKTAFTGGLFGLSGTVVFYIMEQDELTFLWAIHLATVGSICAIFCVFIISRNNRPPPTEGAMVFATPQVGGQVIMEAGGGQVTALSTMEAGGQPGAGMSSGRVQSAYPAALQSYGPSASVYHVPSTLPQTGFSTQYTYSQGFSTAPPQ